MRLSGSSTRPTAWVLACAILLAAAACGGGDDGSAGNGGTDPLSALVTLPAPGEPRPGGTLVYGLAAETDGWDPANSQWAGSGTTVSYAVFDRLAMHDAEGVPRPYLAESIESDAEFTEWTMRLRPGVTFHDGTALDAPAVARNLERVRASLLLGPAFASVTGITAVDPLTVVLTTDEPWSTFPSAMASQAGAIAAPSMLDDPDGQRRPVGTGPFVFDEWIPDSRLVVTRNPDYWREGQPYLDGIEFRVITDTAARTASLQAGDVDALESNDDEQIGKLQGQATRGEIQLISNADDDEASVLFIGLNTARPPFDDPEARRIVATALDTATLSRTLFSDLFPPADSLFPPTSPFYEPDSGYPSYDPAALPGLVEAYEERTGGKLRFSVNIPPLAQYREVAQTAQAQAAEFGIEIAVEEVEQSQLIVRGLTGDYEATGFATFGDPNRDQVFIASTTVRPVGQISLNFTRFADPELQQALDAIRATADVEDQARQWSTVQRRLAENLNLVFLVYQRTVAAFDDQVFGFADPTFPEGAPLGRSTSPQLGTVWLAG
jgi:peptide/nickel transport system substrate-binding protein